MMTNGTEFMDSKFGMNELCGVTEHLPCPAEFNLVIKNELVSILIIPHTV